MVSDLKYFEEVLKSDGCHANKDVLSLRKEVFTLVNQLDAAVNVCADEDALHAAKQHTKAAITVMDAIRLHPSQPSLPKKRSIAPNSKC